MLNALLFDLDGTLTDTDELHVVAFRQILAQDGRSFTDEEFDRHISGRANAEIGRYLFPDRDAAHHEQFAAAKEALFRDLATTLQPTTGLLRVLAHAKAQHMPMAVVTNAPRANADHMLKALAVFEHFQAVVVAEELERAKPDPLPYLTGLLRLGADAHSALAFEDSLPGLTAAKQAGIFTVGITTTMSRASLLAAGADLVIDDFEDATLWSILERQELPS